MVIKELHGRADLRAWPRIEGDDLAFPLGLEQIVVEVNSLALTWALL